MSDQLARDQLAQLARDTVRNASRARLMIHGCAIGPDSPVMGLHTDNGWPVFWCDLESAVAAAAQENQGAVLTVFGPPDAAQAVTVLLRGQLEIIGRSRDHGRPVGAVALVPAQVLVETSAAGRPAVSQAVPADEYASVGRDWLAARAAQIMEHTNAAHGAAVDRFVAARAGVPAASVAAAWLTGLDPQGAQVGWVDTAGAHTMTARFPRQARTATELTMLLRQVLAGGRAGGGHEEHDEHDGHEGHDGHGGHDIRPEREAREE